ncbi:unnamed protein product [Toxocara canis]|uniref:Transcription elongation factor GreB n=1 Tax=Toxocara canis TaxID=6265 RepID=A0A183TZ82_TOXCA|nr:unnamed protein product [Toxocara canis]
MSTDDTLMIQPIRVGRSSSEFSYFNYEASKRDIKEQLQRLHKLNKPAALRAAADLCETIISPARSHKNSQTILVRGEKRMEAELYGNDEDLLTAIES